MGEIRKGIKSYEIYEFDIESEEEEELGEQGPEWDGMAGIWMEEWLAEIRDSYHSTHPGRMLLEWGASKIPIQIAKLIRNWLERVVVVHDERLFLWWMMVEHILVTNGFWKSN